MPQANDTARTRKVQTITTEEQPIQPGESRGLGMPWQEWLNTVDDDELAITRIYIYRKAPDGKNVFKTRLGGDEQPAERIDEEWIRQKFGGGVYSLSIRSKSGKSHYEREFSIDGPAKDEPKGTATAAPVSAADAAIDKLTNLLEKTIDRLSDLQTRQVAPPAPPETTAAVVKVMADAATEAVKIAGQNARAAESGLSKALEDALVKKLLADPPPPPKSTLEDDLARLKLLKDIVGPPPGSSSGLVAQLKDLLEIRELLGGNEATDWKTALVQAAPAVLDKLGQIQDQRAVASQNDLERARIAAQIRRGGAPAAPAGAALPTSATPPAPARSGIPMAPMATPGAPSEPPPAAAGRFNPESPEFVEFIKERIVAMIEEGADGEALIDFLSGNRQERFISMLVSLPEADVAKFLANDPILARAVAHPDWKQVLEEARRYATESAAGATPARRPPVQ